MANPISSASASINYASQAPSAAAAKAQPAPQQSTSLPSDTVSLKSTSSGGADRDGDSH